ncbi:hypothetical protein HPB50_004690 [Hyalomma asiaticum]|uniref:Uncharacterized protein n=1 Tax=Hyalomma asiaticum TaxID=266040 RepID=A0ACB7STB7_HYAAI|nr:hypothetical protein HPB50_004690 [Hyalomma asiaticum]
MRHQGARECESARRRGRARSRVSGGARRGGGSGRCQDEFSGVNRGRPFSREEGVLRRAPRWDSAGAPPPTAPLRDPHSLPPTGELGSARTANAGPADDARTAILQVVVHERS